VVVENVTSIAFPAVVTTADISTGDCSQFDVLFAAALLLPPLPMLLLTMVTYTVLLVYSFALAPDTIKLTR
jgi:hypothetical protein